MFLRRLLVWVLMSAGVVVGQEMKPASTAELPSVDTLPRNYPVFRLQGDCPKTAKAASAKSCETTVTREEFEEMVSAINPKMTPRERREFADSYAQLLALSREAHKRGIDREPRVKALLQYARMTALASAMSKELYSRAQNPSEEEVEKYFAENKPFFTKYSFERIYIPRERQGQSGEVKEGKDLEQQIQENQSSSSDEMKAMAAAVHEKAVAGEAFAVLQERAFNAAGLNSPAEVKMDFEPGQLPKSQNAAFDLPVGGISAVLPDETGFYIYKLVGKHAPELKEVHEEVVLRMQTTTVTGALKNIETFAKTKVNEDYFNKYAPPVPDPKQPDVDTD